MTCFTIHTWISPADLRCWDGGVGCVAEEASRRVFRLNRGLCSQEMQEMLRHHQTAVTLTTLIHLWAQFWTLQIFTWMSKLLESSDITGTILLAVFSYRREDVLFLLIWAHPTKMFEHTVSCTHRADMANLIHIRSSAQFWPFPSSEKANSEVAPCSTALTY